MTVALAAVHATCAFVLESVLDVARLAACWDFVRTSERRVEGSVEACGVAAVCAPLHACCWACLDSCQEANFPPSLRLDWRRVQDLDLASPGASVEACLVPVGGPWVRQGFVVALPPCAGHEEAFQEGPWRALAVGKKP